MIFAEAKLSTFPKAFDVATTLFPLHYTYSKLDPQKWVSPVSPIRPSKKHQVSFQLHEELAEKLKIESYRKLPVLSVSPGKRSSRVPDLCEWLDGDIEDIRMMDPNGAQVAPLELCTKLIDAAVAEGAELLIGAAEGVETEADGDIERVTGGFNKTFADVMHPAVFVHRFCFGCRIELYMN